MVQKYNLKSIIAGLITFIAGIFSILLDLYVWCTKENLWISIGCSLIASGLVILLTALFVDRIQLNPLDEWKIEAITSTRAEMNKDCDEQLEKVRHQVDVIAFGLNSFRTAQTENQILAYLKKGVNFRILTMDPNSHFISEREKAEEKANIRNTIEKLIEWANKLNDRNTKGKIIVKGYDTMTLDFYWRTDNSLYVGPYWYGYDSQQTITYKFVKGGRGFRLYEEYFNRLWENDILSKPLTKFTGSRR